MTIFDAGWDELHALAAQGYLRIARDGARGLALLTYSEKTQYTHVWDQHPILMQCRGIVVTQRGEIIARPFAKFFNLDERPETERARLMAIAELPEVTPKRDGSLVVMWHWNGDWHFSTRGSFASRQAILARECWARHHRDATSKLHSSMTYLFEYTGPDNPVVVRYDVSQLTLLTMFVRDTGLEPPYAMVADNAYRLGVPVVPMQRVSLDVLLSSPPIPNAEGYVCHWRTAGLRVKVKFDAYRRLHRLLSDMDDVRVWGSLIANNDDAVRESLPEEHLAWFEATRDRLKGEYAAHLDAIQRLAAALGVVATDDRDRRKALAEAINARGSAYRAELFALLAGKPIAPIVWARIRPARRGSGRIGAEP